MIGAVIVTHGDLARTILEEASGIAGKVDRVRALGVKDRGTSEEIKEMIASAVRDVNGGEGVIIFTDMFGGTPTNIALTLMEEGVVEIVTGVNLPLIIKFLNNREGMGLKKLASLLVEHGHKSIVLASEMLKGGK
ncbi:MAG: PTS sugar transporter subunit IIA [Deltaproteobacteria bacterium]|nr:PTS sugar transporter subunit IIA [Deltaproteobacteria bacterium]